MLGSVQFGGQARRSCQVGVGKRMPKPFFFFWGGGLGARELCYRSSFGGSGLALRVEGARLAVWGLVRL